jgi:YggT family protein
MTLSRFVAPVIRPFRRLLPPIGGLDFSCWLASVALILAQLLVVAPLYELTGKLP